MIDTNELRRLAQAATSGPWKKSRAFELGPISDADDQSYGIVIPIADVYGDNKAADIAYIAAANPAAISELLDHLEAAEAECLEQARLNGMGSEREAALMAKIDRLRRALIAMTNGYKSVPYAQWPPGMHFAAEVLEETK